MLYTHYERRATKTDLTMVDGSLLNVLLFIGPGSKGMQFVYIEDVLYYIYPVPEGTVKRYEERGYVVLRSERELFRCYVLLYVPGYISVNSFDEVITDLLSRRKALSVEVALDVPDGLA